jgi:hypothetical protein
MKTKNDKELLGEKIDHCMTENFKNGCDTIIDISEQYDLEFGQFIDDEKTEQEFWEESWEKTENFLCKMNSVRRTHKNYSTIYMIDFYGNDFWYSKEMADTFLETWKTWDDNFLQGGKNRKWFYYFIDQNIEEKFREELTNESFTIQNIEDFCEEEISEDIICEAENNCIECSNRPEIIAAEDFFEQQREELYGGWSEREEICYNHMLEIEAQREKEIADDLNCLLENQSIEPDED